MKRIKEDNVVKYCDDNSVTRLELVYDEGKITQLRFYLDDEDETISDKKLYVDPKRFKGGYSFSYVRRSENDGIKRTEYYQDDVMTNYSLEERTLEYKLTRIYTVDDILYDETKIFYNERGMPYRLKEWTKGLTPKDTSFHDTSIPEIEGYEDASLMTEQDWEEYSEIIFQYLHSEVRQPFVGGDELPF